MSSAPPTPKSPRPGRLDAVRRAAVSTALISLITLVVFLMVEGAASLLVVAGSRGEGMPLEESHTEFDSELGWINLPGVRLDDLYGAGAYLQTNSQRFRNREDFQRSVPRGKFRVVCTGDSFTLGYGVANDDAWCELLRRKDQRLETVNMGQGGYGVDQAFLWYRRDGLPLEHDLLIFAFTATDFGRMMSSTFTGYPKPVLAVRGGKPEIARRSSWLRYVARGVGQRVRHLRSMQLWRSWRPSSEPGQPDPRVMSEDEGRLLALAVFEELRRILVERKTSLIAVLLPVQEDYAASDADAWRAFLSAELPKRQIPFLDLVGPLRSLPPELVPRLFRGHYNELGNRWVAERLYDAIADVPGAGERLRKLAPLSQPPPSLVPPETFLAVEPIALDAARIRTNAMGELAGRALDGSRATRWDSGTTQAGHEEIVLDLGTPRRFRQIRLQLGEWGYDYGRTLALDVALEETGYREALRVRGDQVLSQNIDGSQAQLLTLSEAVEARYLRIRQIARDEANFWSVAEIELFTEKQAAAAP